MSSYLFAIRTAALYFPLAALLITIPFVLYKYRKYGAVHFMYFLCIYLFIFYIMCVYCLVILPLPEVEEVAQWTSKTYNLQAFSYVGDVLGDVTGSSGSWVHLIVNSKWLEPLFNILMLVPFGIFVRYYKRWSWWKTLRFSFYLSMFFELTQLSGLYTMYPRPYRLFDVNDLIDNTAGGMVGYLITPLFTGFLPAREKIDRIAYINGSVAGFGRRAAAFYVDIILYGLVFFVPYLLFPVFYNSIVMAFITALIMYVMKGRTPGKMLVRMKVVDTHTGDRPSFPKLLARQLVTVGWFYGVPFSSPSVAKSILDPYGLTWIMSVLWFISVLFLLYDGIISRKRDDKQFFYEEYLHTANIPVPEPASKTMPPVKWRLIDSMLAVLTLAFSAVLFWVLPGHVNTESYFFLLGYYPLFTIAAGMFWRYRRPSSYEVPVLIPVIFALSMVTILSRRYFPLVLLYELTVFIGMELGTVLRKRKDNAGV